MKKLQVLVATMNQKDFSKISQMNIQSDVIFTNQTDSTFYLEEKIGEINAKMISTTTKGVGVNRNIGLMYSESDYLLFSDDDVRYDKDYEHKIIEAFEKIPNADAIIFNMRSLYGRSAKKINNKIKRVKWYNAFSYGAIRIAVKRISIKRENIVFNQNFGGGTDFSSGEDSIFISDMLKKGLKIYTSPEYLGVVDDSIDNSTWFKGYNKKYYYDKGVLFQALNKKISKILCFQDLIRHKNYKKNNLTLMMAYRCMLKGIKNYNELKKYSSDDL